MITLLKLQEHTLMSEQAEDLTVFVPFFGIQSAVLLKKLAGGGVGPETADAVSAGGYDLVFMDHMMPGMDGTQAFKKIRSLPDKTCSSVPVVVLTANASGSMQRGEENE